MFSTVEVVFPEYMNKIRTILHEGPGMELKAPACEVQEVHLVVLDFQVQLAKGTRSS